MVAFIKAAIDTSDAKMCVVVTRRARTVAPLGPICACPRVKDGRAATRYTVKRVCGRVKRIVSLLARPASGRYLQVHCRSQEDGIAVDGPMLEQGTHSDASWNRAASDDLYCHTARCPSQGF